MLYTKKRSEDASMKLHIVWRQEQDKNIFQIVLNSLIIITINQFYFVMHFLCNKKPEQASQASNNNRWERDVDAEERVKIEGKNRGKWKEWEIKLRVASYCDPISNCAFWKSRCVFV